LPEVLDVRVRARKHITFKFTVTWQPSVLIIHVLYEIFKASKFP